MQIDIEEIVTKKEVVEMVREAILKHLRFQIEKGTISRQIREEFDNNIRINKIDFDAYNLAINDEIKKHVSLLKVDKIGSVVRGAAEKEINIYDFLGDHIGECEIDEVGEIYIVYHLNDVMFKFRLNNRVCDWVWYADPSYWTDIFDSYLHNKVIINMEDHREIYY